MSPFETSGPWENPETFNADCYKEKKQKFRKGMLGWTLKTEVKRGIKN